MYEFDKSSIYGETAVNDTDLSGAEQKQLRVLRVGRESRVKPPARGLNAMVKNQWSHCFRIEVFHGTKPSSTLLQFAKKKQKTR